MANTWSIDQVSTVLREVLKQAEGAENVAALDTNQLLTLGETAIHTPKKDAVMNAITQVITRTIFSSRKYDRKFKSMLKSESEWGNMVRKIVSLDDNGDLVDNASYDLTDGVSVDPFIVTKPKVAQFNFVGQMTYELRKTIFDTQLNTAFNSMADFSAFIAMVFTYVDNKIEKIHEETARACLSGFIASKIKSDTTNVIHLVSEYKTLIGQSAYTLADLMKPENFGSFMKWVYARMETVSNMMTEYSNKFHKNLTAGNIMRHTPKALQDFYVYAPVFYEVTDRVLADTYHESFLRLADSVEMVNFWQSIDNPDEINVTTPEYINNDGAVVTADANVVQSNVFAVICDREAMGYSPILERVKSIYNPRGEYTNWFWKFNERTYRDESENFVVFLLD